MRVIDSLDGISPEEFEAGSCVAIGKFDGMHRGHDAVLSSLRDAARAEGLLSVVVTFANNPLSYLRPEACPRALMSREQRLEAFAAAGIDVCVMVEFDASFASILAEQFVADVLVRGLRAQHIIMGADFRFGHLGAGDGELLQELGGRYGFTAEIVDWVEDDELGRVSSSRVRSAVLSGDVEAAAQMLGHPVAVRGDVVHGDARGRELGFPTANLGGRIEGLVPADGVYAGWVLLEDGADADPAGADPAGADPAGADPAGAVRRGLRVAAISVGNNPSFTPEALSRVEAFILDFDRDLYGQRIEVRFAHRLRDMARIDTLEALIDQMHADVARTRQLLET